MAATGPADKGKRNAEPESLGSKGISRLWKAPSDDYCFERDELVSIRKSMSRLALRAGISKEKRQSKRSRHSNVSRTGREIREVN
jgi:hypothetical protein